jgi:hypothetical protein
VRSTDDYGVNASLKALVTKAGLEAGDAFVEHRNTVWRLQGTSPDHQVTIAIGGGANHRSSF